MAPEPLDWSERMPVYRNFFGAIAPQSASPANIVTGSLGSEPLDGTAGADQLVGGGDGHPMSGLAGDDTYQVNVTGDTVSEAPGQGVDTVEVRNLKTYLLPDEVENLSLFGKMTVSGNALGNLIVGNIFGQTINGQGGDDVLVGGGGSDVFVFSAGSGYDVVTDFTSKQADRVRIQDYGFTTFQQVKDAMTEVGSDVVLQLSPTDAVKFLNKTIASFQSSDFQLASDLSSFHLSFSDEFDGPLSLYDPATGLGTWKPSYSTGDQSGLRAYTSHTLRNNDEKELYVDPSFQGSTNAALGLDPFSVTDGVLDISARPTTDTEKPSLWYYDYTSGLLTTAASHAQTYGYFEVKAQLPEGQGAWPSFWLLPTTLSSPPELDVVEQTGGDTVFFTSHSTVAGVQGSNTPIVGATSGFHTYGLLWTSKDLTWYVDGGAVASLPTPADMNKPMYMLLNLALGGNFPGDPAADFTGADFKIDYVRAYTLGASDGFDGDLAVLANQKAIGEDAKAAAPFTVTGLDAGATATVTFVDAANNSVTMDVAANGDFTADLSSLASGPITVSIEAHSATADPATGASDSFVIDPGVDTDLKIALPFTAGANATFDVAGLDAGASAVATFTDLFGQSVTADVAANGPLSVDLSSLGNGDVSVTLEETTALGEARTGRGGVFGLDATADESADLGLQLPTIINHLSRIDFSVVGLDRDAFGVVTFTDAVGHTVTTTVNSDSAPFVDLTGFVDGVVTVSVTATDDALNTAASAPATFVIDTTADVGANLTVAAPEIADPSHPNVGFDVSGLDSDATAVVRFTDAASHVIEVSVAGNGTYAIDLSALAAGPITTTIVATDLLGNTAAGVATPFVFEPVRDFFGNEVPRSAAPTNAIIGSSGSEPLAGTAGADLINGGGAGHAMTGGPGDDTFNILSINDKVTENPGEGVDTLVVAGTKGANAIKYWHLPDNAENMVLSNTITGFGNAGQNIIDGGIGNQVLVGKGGDDVLTGGAGADVFHFDLGSGHDVVTDFNSAEGDRVRLANYGFLKFSDVQAAMTQDGDDVILQLSPTDAVKFLNHQVSDFQASDFILPIDASKLQLTYDDEFDTLNLDPATGYDTFFPFSSSFGPDSEIARTHNDELQIYVDPTYGGSGSTPLGINPFSDQNGVLTITATKTTPEQKADLFDHDYASGLITTAPTFYQQYGYFEMRAKLPFAHGMWSAFWLLPKDATPDLELDVVENIGDDRSYATEHHTNSNGVKVVTNQGHIVDDVTQWHTYGLLWTAQELDWYVDGVVVYSQPTSPDQNRPMYILANLALGGRFPGPPDPGFTTASMQIDYIRAYAVDPNATALTINDGAPPPAFDTYSGGDGGDVLSGSSGPDLIQGFGGADALEGGLGDDTLDGGDGEDKVKYFYATGGVAVSLAVAGPQDTHGAGVDTLINIEDVIGSSQGDTLSGDDHGNLIDGRGGPDIIEGGLGGDVLRGGDGDDTVSYAHAPAAVAVNLSITANQNTLGAGVDKLSEFENLRGSAFNDTLTGDGGDNRIEGGPGDDLMTGGGGNDSVSYAGATSGVTVNLSITTAQDTGGAGTDTFSGFEKLIGSAYADSLTGDAGNNTINGGDGADSIDAGQGADVLQGGAGDDVLQGGLGDDTLAGGGGVDDLFGGDGVDTAMMTGAKADYSFVITPDGVEIHDLRPGAPDGSVRLHEVERVAFTDTITDAIGLVLPGATIHGTAGADFISTTKTVAGQPVATNLADVIYGEAGNDKIDGGDGDDLMIGGDGNDTYTVNSSGDQIVEEPTGGTGDKVTASASYTLPDNVEKLTLVESAVAGTGNSGDNFIYGNGVDNVLTGLAGKDWLDGGGGADSLYGGADDDTYVVDNPGDRVFEVDGEGKDLVKSKVSFTLSANVETLKLAGAAAVDGAGNEGANQITGNDAANLLSGAGGLDTLSGAGGDDTIIGGAGKDKLTGGAGADTFVFGPASATDADSVTDFAPGVDHLAFHAADYGLAVGPLDPSMLVFGSGAADAHAEFVYDATKKTLLWDADGAGAAAAVSVATFSFAVALTSADFLVIA
jgi:Ca2+-binding RTX toxin-like protein